MNANEPAFPIPAGRICAPLNGLTKREYFAAMALGAKLAPGLIGYEDHAPDHRKELIRRLSRDCVEIADALIAELSKGESK